MTMCAVTATSLLTRAVSDSWLAIDRNRCSAACVARKPRHRKLRATRGSSTMARRKSSCAGRSSALNRRSRTHIGRENLEQTAIHEPAQKFHQVGAKQFRFDIEFGEKLLGSHVNVRRTRHELPHARAGLDERLCPVASAHKNYWHPEAQLKEKDRLQMWSRPEKKFFLNYDFFFFTLTFISMPAPSAFKSVRPCFACCPHGPFGSSSSAF